MDLVFAFTCTCSCPCSCPCPVHAHVMKCNVKVCVGTNIKYKITSSIEFYFIWRNYNQRTFWFIKRKWTRNKIESNEEKYHLQITKGFIYALWTIIFQTIKWGKVDILSMSLYIICFMKIYNNIYKYTF